MLPADEAVDEADGEADGEADADTVTSARADVVDEAVEITEARVVAAGAALSVKVYVPETG